jgi:hypothetical protein
MHVNLDDLTVTITGEVTLTLSQLRSLVEILEDELDVQLADDFGDDFGDEVGDDYHPEWVNLARSYLAASDRSSHLYSVVLLEDGTWACSCPDWLYRRSVLDGQCKHIYRTRWLR